MAQRKDWTSSPFLSDQRFRNSASNLGSMFPPLITATDPEWQREERLIQQDPRRKVRMAWRGAHPYDYEIDPPPGYVFIVDERVVPGGVQQRATVVEGIQHEDEVEQAGRGTQGALVFQQHDGLGEPVWSKN